MEGGWTPVGNPVGMQVGSRLEGGWKAVAQIMKPEAVEAARERLDRAERAVVRLERGGFDLAALRSEWIDYLAAAHVVFSKLEQGVKGNPAAYAWFGARLQDRRTDPLLSYLHHARNAQDHGIPGSVRKQRMGLRAESPETKLVRDPSGRVTSVVHPVGVPISVKVVPPHLSLEPVRDRGTLFQPPTAHFGVALPEVSPATVARAGLAYLSWMIGQAEGFCPPG